MRFPLLVSRLENRHQLQIVIKGEYDRLIHIGAARDETAVANVFDFSRRQRQAPILTERVVGRNDALQSKCRPPLPFPAQCCRPGEIGRLRRGSMRKDARLRQAPRPDRAPGCECKCRNRRLISISMAGLSQERMVRASMLTLRAGRSTVIPLSRQFVKLLSP